MKLRWGAVVFALRAFVLSIPALVGAYRILGSRKRTGPKKSDAAASLFFVGWRGFS
jgi:hypothetical protein